MDLKETSILVVEDIKIVQKATVMALEILNWKVDTVDNGMDALEKTKRKKYDIILMDIGLPDMDGYTVTETIRSTECKIADKKTKIIALTAHIEERSKQKAIESGMDDFISKPLTLEKAKKFLDNYS